MNKDSIIDYLSYILFRAAGFIIRKLPVGFSFFLGRRLGDLLYYFDLKHRAIAYSNIKTALGDSLSPLKLTNTTGEFYRAYGQNLMEVFLMPLVDNRYINKYISIEGSDNINLGLEKGKGIIFLAIHEGSWELSNIIQSIFSFQFNFLFREQEKFKRITRLLNSYRIRKGCKIIKREHQTRQIIEVIKNNEAIGMTVDQGGKAGTLVNFFGRSASMATGAVRIGLKYDTTILPVFFTRLAGPYVKLFIDKPFEVKKTGGLQRDIRENLQELMYIYEKYIATYPQEYLWSYKIWKYGLDRNILILSDAKTGHLRQSQAVADIISGYFKEKGFETKLEIEEVNFRNKFSKILLKFSSCLSGKFNCQGCLACLRKFLDAKTYNSLIEKKPNVIISCGSSLAAVNFLLSRENLAKSIVLMKPQLLSTGRFNLVIMPAHDNPPRRKNIAVTEGALNLINEEYLKEQTDKLIQASGFRLQASGSYIGLLIGGDTKTFRLEKDTILEVIKQVKSACEKLGADILVTTSRRTTCEVEKIIKAEFKDYSRCKLLVIANEKNIPQALGAILSLSQIIITTPESISMISEAVNSKKHVLVFKAGNLGKKHSRFLNLFSKNKYIRLIENVYDLSGNIEDIWLNKPQIKTLSDNFLIKEAIGRIL